MNKVVKTLLLPLIPIVTLGLTHTSCNSKDNTTKESEPSVAHTSSRELPSYERLSMGDWFTAKCELLCDEQRGRFLDLEKLQRYGQHKPYDIKQVSKQDSVIIAFDFIADCCLDFAGGAKIQNDTLILEYQLPHDSLMHGCECSCDYRMIYKVDKKDKNWVDLKAEYKRRL